MKNNYIYIRWRAQSQGRFTRHRKGMYLGIAAQAPEPTRGALARRGPETRPLSRRGPRVPEHDDSANIGIRDEDFVAVHKYCSDTPDGIGKVEANSLYDVA